VEIQLNFAGAAAGKLTKRLCRLLGKKKTASSHLMYGAHACLVPVNYATTNVVRQLEDKQKAACNTRACDYSHLMLLMTFILSNLFREEDPILAVLPDKFARFLYEFHDFRFENLDLPPPPAD
jgi:hypothetical protein